MIFFKKYLTWSLIRQNVLIKRNLFQLSATCQSTTERKLVLDLHRSLELNRKLSTNVLVNELLQKKCSTATTTGFSNVRNYSSNKTTTTTTSDTPDNKASSNSELIIQHHNDGILEIQLNRAQGKNSLSKRIIFELEVLLASIKNDNRIRCIIIRSLVPGVFCSGADLKERLKMKMEDIGPFVSKLRKTFDDIAKIRVPVIAAIDGVALGGGLELALACDMRVAVSNAKLGLVETKRAIIPGAGGTQRLPRVVGIAKAKELIYTGKVLDGDEAKAIGLVNESVKQNDQQNAAYKVALEMAQEIVKNGPIAIRMAKQSIDSGSEVDIAAGLVYEELCYAQVIPTKDRIEGLNSFVEKRNANYVGE